MNRVKIGIGQDSHRFLKTDSAKPCIVAGVVFEELPGLMADSDGDVVFHAICNGITSVTHIPILGGIAQEMCKKNGITDSAVYLTEAMKTLENQMVEHVALTIEGKRPKFQPHIDKMRDSVAKVMHLDLSQVGLTVTSGDGLTEFGCGVGLQCLCILTVMEG